MSLKEKLNISRDKMRIQYEELNMQIEALYIEASFYSQITNARYYNIYYKVSSATLDFIFALTEKICRVHKEKSS